MGEEEEFYTYLFISKNINFNSFENNWPYIVQSTRNSFNVFRYKDSILYFTYKKDDLNTIVVVNCLGREIEECIFEFSRKKNQTHNILMKNVDKNKLKKYMDTGFNIPNDMWSSYSNMDDNSYAQYNLEANTVLNKRYGRTSFRQPINRLQRSRKILTIPYEQKWNTEAEILLEKYADYSFKKGTDYKEEIIGAHMFFFDEKIKNKIRYAHIENNKLIGFSFLTPVGSIIFYNMIIYNNESDLMKYLLHESMINSLTEFPNIKYFGLQGSENKGQNFFKEMMNPSEIIEKTHLFLEKSKFRLSHSADYTDFFF